MNGRDAIRMWMNSQYGAMTMGDSDDHTPLHLNDAKREIELSVGGEMTIGVVETHTVEVKDMSVEFEGKLEEADIDADEIVRELEQGMDKEFSISFDVEPHFNCGMDFLTEEESEDSDGWDESMIDEPP